MSSREQVGGRLRGAGDAKEGAGKVLCLELVEKQGGWVRRSGGDHSEGRRRRGEAHRGRAAGDADCRGRAVEVRRPINRKLSAARGYDALRNEKRNKTRSAADDSCASLQLLPSVPPAPLAASSAPAVACCAAQRARRPDQHNPSRWTPVHVATRPRAQCLPSVTSPRSRFKGRVSAASLRATPVPNYLHFNVQGRCTARRTNTSTPANIHADIVRTRNSLHRPGRPRTGRAQS